ncbi:MAG: peptidylprolyl isomerase, partial [Planctomycetota bacterium]|nr:peptidylprolyl isomerase [Planctomycetota bacterium]
GKQSEEILAKHGYPPGIVRDELEFRLAWREYVEQFQEGKGVREYFEKHHEWFDGTEVHARQIFKKVAGDDESAGVTAETQLRQVRSKIVAGELDFASAAKQHSDAPSRDEGGDVGWFPYRGKMPPVISQAAFALVDGEVSEPFRSPFGVHLVQVVERKEGELNLEDVREQVLSEFSESLWRSTADELRKSAKIEREALPSGKK